MNIRLQGCDHINPDRWTTIFKRVWVSCLMICWSFFDFFSFSKFKQNRVGILEFLTKDFWKNKIGVSKTPSIQWKLLQVITGNIFVQLMCTNWPRFTKFQITTYKVLFMSCRFAYCYHLVNLISFSISQSDHIKLIPYLPHFQKSNKVCPNVQSLSGYRKK